MDEIVSPTWPWKTVEKQLVISQCHVIFIRKQLVIDGNWTIKHTYEQQFSGYIWRDSHRLHNIIYPSKFKSNKLRWWQQISELGALSLTKPDLSRWSREKRNSKHPPVIVPVAMENTAFKQMICLFKMEIFYLKFPQGRFSREKKTIAGPTH